MQNGISQQSPNPPLDRITYIAAINDYLSELLSAARFSAA
jgi:hypothetical protein